MNAVQESQVQNIGWNGLAMQVPASWHPAVILKDYLLFEDQYQQALELKWQYADGVFSPNRTLKQLRRAVGKKDGFSSWPLPAPWKEALDDLNCLGFQWQEGEKHRRGLLLYSSSCKRVTLLQFYISAPEHNPACLHILKTLRDHTQGDQQCWAIYDITFSLPATAELLAQEFHTGRYRISFKLGELFFSLLRFKPAKILLARGGLEEFAKPLLRHGEHRITESNDLHQSCWQKKGSNWQRLKAKLRRQCADHLLFLHHVPEKNVILGIQAKSNQPINQEDIRAIKDNYTAH